MEECPKIHKKPTSVKVQESEPHHSQVDYHCGSFELFQNFGAQFDRPSLFQVGFFIDYQKDFEEYKSKLGLHLPFGILKQNYTHLKKWE